MPWPKVRKTLAQRRQENREKSARHYAKHRTRILASKKTARDLNAREAELYKSGTRHRSKEEEQERRLGTIGASSTAQMKQISNKLVKYLSGSASGFFDSLYQSCIDYNRSNPDNNSPNMSVQEAETTLTNLLTACYRLENEILQDELHMEYQKARVLTKRVKCILDCVYNMEMIIMDPDEDLEQAYHRRRLDFQKRQVQAWIDGAEPIPE
ncbi:hypothetical protein VNI00_015546 [Paramarasmius palmivorus]|uniref:Uncharacterized protein n=1 Tax=Paramarasmius palmivorus TaxID=297713 RepID=A0AAW0BLH9_9AGAR